MVATPTRFGDYIVETTPGQAPTAAAFQARHATSGAPAIVKLVSLPPDPGEAQSLRDVLPQWADVLCSLDHPAILRVIEVGVVPDTGVPFLVYEDFAGESVAAGAARGRRLADAQAVAVATSVTEALAQAHSEGIIHGRIGSGSILVGPGGAVKLADLGLALGGRTGVGAAGQDPALRHYLSPEQLHSRPVDTRSDLFSLGVVLFEMLIGQPPFPAEGIGYAQSLATAPVAPLPREQRHDLPGPLNGLLFRLLQADPGHRPTTAVEVLEALQTARSKLTATVIAPRPKASPKASANTGLWILVAAGVLVILIGAGFALSILIRPVPKPALLATPAPTPTAMQPDREMDRLHLQAAVDAGNLREAQRMIAELRAAGRLGPELIPLAVRTDQLGRNEARPLVDKGIEMHRQGKHAQAIEAFLQAQAITPDDPEVAKLLDASRAARRDMDEDDRGPTLGRTRLKMAAPTPEGKELELLFPSQMAKGCVHLDLDGAAQSPVCFDFTKAQFMGIARRTGGTVTGGWSVAAGSHRATLRLVDDAGKVLMEAPFTFQVAPGRRFQAQISTQADGSRPMLTLAALLQ